ncbi:MAG: Glucosyl-3-phosphoglycerate phosphatase [uncultured Nocardioidaceae bacterium]|uniref:Glucosyl-3-phosphoglycerate phosphatase n=1 Tax=uncultured Nocardioidaceae bacterium TaxID=253824 RepID=A0A6J4M4E9_9ACTN|nr:MAG: Glucosyl-3-phosphoglycerate phosphatase [uncultured Nocardioidaceae bacterium]
MSRRLVVWRHGRTEWNAQGIAQGQSDVPLDDVGREQASTAAPLVARYEPARIVSSDLSRALDTAQALADLAGLAVQPDPRLREFDLGAREGQTMQESFAMFPDEMAAWQRGEEARFGAGETLGEAAKRFAAALDDVADATGPGDVSVVVSHGGGMRAGICAWLGFPQSLWGRFGGFGNCRWAVLQEQTGRRGHFRITDWNAGAVPEYDNDSDGQHAGRAAAPADDTDAAPNADDV